MTKFIQTLCCTLICFIVSTTIALAQVQETFTICPGASIFLPAVQEFPAPPEVPAGPDGNSPTAPCTPQLRSTDIVPLSGIRSGNLMGFTVSPTTSTKYKVTSNGVCGGPGSTNTNELSVIYEVLVQACAPPVQETFTICSGESVFLPAIQEFPAGPAGPVNSTLTPCTPQLTDISIAPMANATIEALGGFKVSPTTTTIYTLTSDGFCGAPDIGSNRDQIDFVYEIIVESACDTIKDTNNVISNYPWLHQFIEVDNCSDAAVIVYEKGNNIFLLVTDEAGDQKLYREDGTFYCQNASNYDCVALYKLAKVSNTWECGDGVEACATYKGTFIFDDCNGTDFYFIELEDGRILDPYFADNISFEPLDGQSVLFDYVEADFASPCTIAEKAVILTCIQPIDFPQPQAAVTETIQTPVVLPQVFQEFRWLTSLFDPNNCSGETVVVYKKGAHHYLLVTNKTGKRALYSKNGSYYCQDEINFDCVGAFGLSEVVDTWECGNGRINCDNGSCDNLLFIVYDWLHTLVNTSNCESESVHLYKSGASIFLLVESNGVQNLYFRDGTFFCQMNSTYNCLEAYELDRPLASWVCSEEESEDNLSPISPRIQSPTDPLKVFPNPTSGLFKVPLAPQAQAQEVRLYDLHGRILDRRTVEANETIRTIELDISQYPTGIYYLEWQSGTERTIQKVVKQAF